MLVLDSSTVNLEKKMLCQDRGVPGQDQLKTYQGYVVATGFSRFDAPFPQESGCPIVKPDPDKAYRLE